MTPQLEEARRFLRLAQRDRGTFDLLLPLEKASLAAIGFHAQQSAEKALKAVAVYGLLPICKQSALMVLGATASVYPASCWVVRYPGHDGFRA